LQNYSIETVSGGVESGETPLETAIRELREEFGLEAREWISLGTIYPFTSVINSASYLFLALGVELKHKPTPDPGEHIETLKLPLEQVVEMVMNGEIINGSACTLILKAYYYLKAREA
jgi:ADP-ribose pyrophosphatase